MSFLCGDCLCAKCANNVDCSNVDPTEVAEPCFNCDECFFYNGKGPHNEKTTCNMLKITNYEANKIRSKFKIIK